MWYHPSFTRAIEKKGSVPMCIDSVAPANGDRCSPTKFRSRPDSLNEWHCSWVLCFSDSDVGHSVIRIPVLGARFSFCYISSHSHFCRRNHKIGINLLGVLCLIRVSPKLFILFFTTYRFNRFEIRHRNISSRCV